MGEDDPLIPVTETRKIAAAMKGKPTFVYHEIARGGLVGRHRPGDAQNPRIAAYAVEEQRPSSRVTPSYIAAGKNLVYIDTAGAALGPYGKPRPEMFSDGLYFNREAYKMFAKVIRPYLE